MAERGGLGGGQFAVRGRDCPEARRGENSQRARRTTSRAEEIAGWFFAAVLIGVGLDQYREWLKDGRRVRDYLRERMDGAPLEKGPLVSVLVPAWNEAGRLRECIDSILGLRYRNKEIIVCAGGSDGSWEEACEYANRGVIVLKQWPGGGKQAALQRCFERSGGDIIFLTDADCILEDQSFEAVLRPVIEGQEEVCTGSWRPMDCQLQNSLVQFQWAQHLCRESALPVYVDSLNGCNAAIRRKAVQRAGAFLAFAPTGTDFVLSTQLLRWGYRIRFVRRSWVRTWYPETARSYWEQVSRWYRNRVTLGFRYHRWSAAISHLRAGIAAAFMLAGPPFIWRSRLLAFIWLAAFARLTLAQLRTRYLFRCLEIHHIRDHFILVNLLIGWIALARGLLESLLPSRRWRW